MQKLTFNKFDQWRIRRRMWSNTNSRSNVLTRSFDEKILPRSVLSWRRAPFQRQRSAGRYIYRDRKFTQHVTVGLAPNEMKWKEESNAGVSELLHIHCCVHILKEFRVQKVKDQCRDKHLYIAPPVSCVRVNCIHCSMYTPFPKTLCSRSLPNQFRRERKRERERERERGAGGVKRLGPLCLANSSSERDPIVSVWPRLATFEVYDQITIATRRQTYICPRVNGPITQQPGSNQAASVGLPVFSIVSMMCFIRS